RDTFWGIAWTLLHAIESAPVEEYESMLPPAGTPQPEDADDWPAQLRHTIENERRHGHSDGA
ncbi:MAG: hypothetical protein M3R12_03845, partial [Actinomycetota bacterium]|nr:hypothetical protein [Actinomycetota bacterium]